MNFSHRYLSLRRPGIKRGLLNLEQPGDLFNSHQHFRRSFGVRKVGSQWWRAIAGKQQAVPPGSAEPAPSRPVCRESAVPSSSLVPHPRICAGWGKTFSKEENADGTGTDAEKWQAGTAGAIPDDGVAVSSRSVSHHVGL
jgi:hypothetical protein